MASFIAAALLYIHLGLRGQILYSKQLYIHLVLRGQIWNVKYAMLIGIQV